MTDYAPKHPGIHVLRPKVSDVVPYVDWEAFLYGWDFKGNYARIMANPVTRAPAEKLIADAYVFLEKNATIFQLQAVCGVFPAHKFGDDFELTRPDGKTFRFFTLRQQNKSSEYPYYYALADFIKEDDFVGAQIVTAGNAMPFVSQMRAQNDDYSTILAQSLFNRLAEAMSEYVHHEMRTRIWGYAPNEKLSIEDLLAGHYQGIRPAPGYPQQPDHSEKFTIFNLLNASETISVRLTESAMMMPEASTCALCFARPQACYFSLGKIASDQLQDYIRRKGWTPEEAKVWTDPLIS